jgi:CRP/FNR family cyclic AMP-dependent transcriptional regulator
VPQRVASYAVKMKELQSKPETFHKGDVLIHEKELSRKMYLLTKGKVRVYKTYIGQKITLAILGAGEVFGELSFFDAEPRSASVEALTDIEVHVVDGDLATKQAETFPEWVWAVFRSVFHRFREMDDRLVIFQNMNQFTKKHYNQDTEGKQIYHELLRFLKALEVCYNAALEKEQKITKQSLLTDMSDVLGSCILDIDDFWALLTHHDFVKASSDKDSATVEMREQQIAKWIDYLHEEIEQNRYALLSHTALAILRRIVESMELNIEIPELKEDAPAPRPNDKFKECGGGKPAPLEGQPLTAETKEMPVQDLKLDTLPLKDEAIAELKKLKLIEEVEGVIEVDPDIVIRAYLYQKILKTFDHSMISVA